jgi:Rhodopirellula transposase DDE domain
MVKLATDFIDTIIAAAKLLTGYKRRRFQAEIAIKYCEGCARRAESIFGWGREAVNTGLNELRTGIRCQDACHLRGRKKSEEVCPGLEERIHRLVEPQAQADPKFQTTFAYTRITAKAVRDALIAEPELDGHVPSRQTVGCLLNRLGYRLRPVQKTRPEKKSPRPTPSSRTSKPRGTVPSTNPTR